MAGGAGEVALSHVEKGPAVERASHGVRGPRSLQIPHQPFVFFPQRPSFQRPFDRRAENLDVRKRLHDVVEGVAFPQRLDHRAQVGRPGQEDHLHETVSRFCRPYHIEPIRPGHQHICNHHVVLTCRQPADGRGAIGAGFHAVSQRGEVADQERAQILVVLGHEEASRRQRHMRGLRHRHWFPPERPWMRPSLPSILVHVPCQGRLGAGWVGHNLSDSAYSPQRSGAPMYVESVDFKRQAWDAKILGDLLTRLIANGYQGLLAEIHQAAGRFSRPRPDRSLPNSLGQADGFTDVLIPPAQPHTRVIFFLAQPDLLRMIVAGRNQTEVRRVATATKMHLEAAVGGPSSQLLPAVAQGLDEIKSFIGSNVACPHCGARISEEIQEVAYRLTEAADAQFADNRPLCELLDAALRRAGAEAVVIDPGRGAIDGAALYHGTVLVFRARSGAPSAEEAAQLLEQSHHVEQQGWRVVSMLVCDQPAPADLRQSGVFVVDNVSRLDAALEEILSKVREQQTSALLPPVLRPLAISVADLLPPD